MPTAEPTPVEKHWTIHSESEKNVPLYSGP